MTQTSVPSPTTGNGAQAEVVDLLTPSAEREKKQRLTDERKGALLGPRWNLSG